MRSFTWQHYLNQLELEGCWPGTTVTSEKSHCQWHSALARCRILLKRTLSLRVGGEAGLPKTPPTQLTVPCATRAVTVTCRAFRLSGALTTAAVPRQQLARASELRLRVICVTIKQSYNRGKSDLRNHQAIVQPEPHGFDPCQGHFSEQSFQYGKVTTTGGPP
jgi:hypothetical protein